MKSVLADEEVEQRPDDEPWLLAPVNSFSEKTRRWVVGICAILVTAWCAFRGGDLPWVWGMPDVKFYQAMAQGRYDQVPPPFSSRPLAPLVARLIASLAHCRIEVGFVALAYGSLFWTLLVVFWLLSRSRAPRWVLPAVAAVPFWPQLLGFAGLPDPLYTALLATLLLALERGRTYFAAAMLLPLMVARESTSLVLVCLLLVAWRQLRWGGASVAVASVAAGAAFVHRFSVPGLPNPEHLAGSVYMLGKVVSNSLRSLGVNPWSNVYPVLCGTPAWQMQLHLGGVRSVGVCSFTYIPLLEMAWVLCTTFGMFPLLLVALRGRWRAWYRHGGLLVPFCLLYGGLSLLLAPALGTWYARLFGYSWPLLLVAVPRLLSGSPMAASGGLLPRASPLWWGALLAAHLLLCGVGVGVGTPQTVASAVILELLAVALFLVQKRGWNEA